MDLVDFNDIEFDKPDSKNATEIEIKSFENSLAEALKHFYGFYRTKEVHPYDLFHSISKRIDKKIADEIVAIIKEEGIEQFEERILLALRKHSKDYMITCMTEEAMRKCANTNK